MGFWRFRECDALCHNVRYLHRMHREAPQWSESLPQRFCHAPQCTARHRGLSACLLVRIRHPGKTAEWIGTRLGMVVGVGPGIGVLNFGGNRRRDR